MRLHAGDLNVFGWGDGPWALVTPVKDNRVVVVVYKYRIDWRYFKRTSGQYLIKWHYLNFQARPESDEWEEREDLPLETRCKIEGMKMMARWLTGLKNDTISAQKTFRMLNAFIICKGDLLEEGRPRWFVYKLRFCNKEMFGLQERCVKYGWPSDFTESTNSAKRKIIRTIVDFHKKKAWINVVKGL